jgi:hypothetical protein
VQAAKFWCETVTKCETAPDQLKTAANLANENEENMEVLGMYMTRLRFYQAADGAEDRYIWEELSNKGSKSDREVDLKLLTSGERPNLDAFLDPRVLVPFDDWFNMKRLGPLWITFLKTKRQEVTNLCGL